MYITKTQNPSGAYSAPQSNYVDGMVSLSASMLTTFLQYNGFVHLTLDGDTVTSIEPNIEAWEDWKASLPQEQPPQPTEMELAQQDITDLQLNDIAQGQQMTDLELMILGGGTNV